MGHVANDCCLPLPLSAGTIYTCLLSFSPMIRDLAASGCPVCEPGSQRKLLLGPIPRVENGGRPPAVTWEGELWLLLPCP